MLRLAAPDEARRGAESRASQRSSGTGPAASSGTVTHRIVRRHLARSVRYEGRCPNLRSTLSH
jgi:hypothetical protein